MFYQCRNTQQQDTTTNKNDTNQNDEDSSDESMESETGLSKPDTKCILLSKNESENEAQHQIITKIANTKKFIILQQKDIALASTYCLIYLWKVVKIAPYQILMEGINMTMERGLNMKDQNHPRYSDYFAYRRSYATKQMKNKLKSKFIDMQRLTYSSYYNIFWSLPFLFLCTRTGARW